MLSFKKVYSQTITHLYLNCCSCLRCAEFDKVEKESGEFITSNANTCCIQYGKENWDTINKLLEKYSVSVTCLTIENPSACLNKIIPVTNFKKLKTLYFQGNDEDWTFDSIPENILEMRSLKKIEFDMVDHALKIKRQIHKRHPKIKVRISPKYMRKKEQNAELSE
jgi:hypothetical protein